MASVGRMKRGVPEGLWIRCPQCKSTIFRKEAESRFNVCPETVRAWIRAGKLHALRTPTGRYRVTWPPELKRKVR